MIPQIGDVVIGLAVALSWATAAVGLAQPGRARLIRGLQIGAAATSVAALTLLTVLMLPASPTIAYAAEHAAPADGPLGYRIAAVWAGQQGGLLLWVAEAALIGLLLRPTRQPRGVAIALAVQAALLTIAALGRPFAPPAPDARIAGLNPLLQHPMMLIHPPMLFLGYALLAIPYALTVGALLDRTPRTWLEDVRPWLLVAWLALTAGNGFGSLWAYKTFGWGGFWAWDPVENTSFVPWVLCGAAVHALWLARFSPIWRRWAAVFAVGGFIAVLYGSFLARSGLLAGASVHAYVAGNTLYVWALGVLLFGGLGVAALALVLGGRAWTGATAAAGAPAETAGGVWAMTAIVLLVLVGMSLPMVGDAPPASAYNAATLPFGFVMMGLLAVRTRPRPSLTRAASGVLIAAVVAIALAIFAALRLPARSGMLVALPLVFAPLTLLASLAVALRALIALITRARTVRRVGAEVAHLGLALMLCGALLAGYQSVSATSFFPLGEEQQLGRHTVTVSAVAAHNGSTGAALVDGHAGEFAIESNERFNIDLRRAFISPRWWGDIYLTPMSVLAEPTPLEEAWPEPAEATEAAEATPERPEADTPDATAGAMPDEGMSEMPAGAMLEVSFKPGMPLLWWGMRLIALGLLLTLLGGRPARREDAT